MRSIIFYIISSVFFKLVCSSKVKRFTDENWTEMLEGEWLVKFYAPWCPACRAVASTWEELASWATTEHSSLSVGSVDVTAQGELNGRFMVTSLPTIYHVRNGEFRQYTSTRTLSDFQDLITKQEWRSIQPMSSWLGPNSVTMSGVSKLFSFSMKLKDFHESLRSDYGLPGWASMLLFGLLIVCIGLSLGIGLVIGLDYFMGPDQEKTPEQIQRKSPDGDINPDEESDKTSDGNNEPEIPTAEKQDEDSTVRKRNVKGDES